MSAKEVLEKAYEYLDKNGWCQNSFGSKESSEVCVHGALRQFAGQRGYGLAFQALEETVKGEPDFAEALRATKRDVGEGVWGWNDAPWRTIEDVKLILKKAIEKADLLDTP